MILQNVFVRSRAALMAIALSVAAIGGAHAADTELASERHHIHEVVVFGDSLSDVGTYQTGVVAKVGGGSYTTNPGRIWAEHIGAKLGIKVTPYRVGYAGVSQVLGGTGYAMGGARVSHEPGGDCFPNSQGICTQQLALSIRTQISDHLRSHGNRFQPDQLVFLWGGANDLFAQIDRLSTGQTDLLGASTAMLKAAADMVLQARRVVQAGGKRVAVLTVPDAADSPFGDQVWRSNPDLARWISGITLAYNEVLKAGLGGNVKLIDTWAAFKDVIANPGKYGVSDTDATACDPAATAAAVYAATRGEFSSTSALFCSRRTLTHPGAPYRYFFADWLHPSTRGHRIISSYVLTEARKQGLLQ